MKDEEDQTPHLTTSASSSSSSSSSTSSATSLSFKKDGSGFEGLFGRGKYKLWALAAIILLALWSMFTGSVTLKWSAVDLKSSSHELDPSIHGDLDVLDVVEREKMVRQMWNVYKHSKIVSLPRFWRDAFGAAYQDLTSEVSSVQDTALLEIAKMSFRSRILLYEPRPLQSSASAAGARVPARGKAMIPTDLSIAIPEGTYARIAPRSGLTWKNSIDVGAGVIDADYRGPVGVILFNHSDADFEVKIGDRIAQLIIEKIMTPEVAEVYDLDSTLRGTGGFGSTGI